MAAPERAIEVQPSVGAVREASRRGECATVWTTFLDDELTAAAAYQRLRGDGPSFLLEPADGEQPTGRHAYIGIHPAELLRWRLGDPGDPYRLVREASGRASRDAGPPLPFRGGAVGLFGYDLVRAVEPLGPPPPDELGLPDLAVMVTDVVVALDAVDRTITIMATVRPEEDPELGHADACRRIAEVRGRLLDPGAGPSGPPRVAAGMFRDGVAPGRYDEMVERCTRYIEAGDAFQVVPSQRWSAPLEGDPFDVHRALRSVNPAPYLFFLDFEDFQLSGASPEPLLQVRDGVATTSPIAGTRARGADPVADLLQEAELLADEKERAEHTMLVDLGRNDLGRVCEPGSVRVDRLMDVVRCSHVMHVVSRVSGTLSKGVHAIDALRSTLPAGTLSGAPKVRAMQIIDELEPVKRGPYGGAVGWLGHDGNLDTAIVIRTAVVRDGRIHVQAGAGVVADSIPWRERRETVDKARAVVRAVELAGGAA
ncbi:Anthranilate synthase aminase component [Patulibacter medicamentivorans]|uniref:Anthranilate synthase component 1 n=1 Tax=Patulibacter medicamentivorans TaxID=1097667 RepID=H0EAI1_9ACTN|nr:anthranilate synthase component I [Patulibacter medicamentivorans]EHN09308.1 Anthranilate synthase aminase component [Patulibacter medicamentivorans]